MLKLRNLVNGSYSLILRPLRSSLISFGGLQNSSDIVCQTCGSGGKEFACSAGDPTSVPESERSPGEGHGNPLQYFCLENSMGRGAWRATFQGLQRVRHDWVTNTFTFHHSKWIKNHFFTAFIDGNQWTECCASKDDYWSWLNSHL